MVTQQLNKYPVIILIAILIHFPGTSIIAQTKWLNFTNTDNVNDVVFQGDFVWVGTSGGLIKLNQVTGEQVFYNRANSGLPSNGISTLCFDNEDNLWVGTFNDGLAKFDGVGWQVFNEENSELRYNRILTLTCDKNGILWIGTQMGLNRFINGNLINDLDVQGILRFIEVVDSGIVFLSFTNGIYTLKNNYQNWGEKYCPHNDLDKLCEAHSFLMINPNEFWVGYEDGLYHYHNKSWNKISNALLGFENRMTVTAICFDNENNLWVGSTRGTISKYNGINSENYNNRNSEIGGGSIKNIKLDLMGNIWICTSSGLYKYSGGFEKFDIKKSIIAQGQSLEVFSDDNKTVWLKNSRELFSFQKDSIKKFDKTNSNFKGIYSMAFSKDDKIWIGDDEGLVLYDGVNWKRFDTLDIILVERDKEIFEKYKDTNWVKKNYKEYLLNEENNSWQISSFATNLHRDKKNTLWFQSSDVLVNFDGQNWILYDTAYSAIPTARFRDFIIDDQNNIWIATWGMGLPKYDGENWSVIDTSNSPFISNQIVSLHNFDKLLFICTKKGIMTFDGNSWEKISTPELEVEFATCMIKDDKNNYWFGSSTGLYKYDGSKWDVFDISNSGIANNLINSISIDYSGNLWIASTYGYLSIFNENGIKDESRINLFLNP